MDINENNQNMNLIFQDKKRLFSNFETLQNNLEGIRKLKQANDDISNSIKAIRKILSLIKPYLNNNHEITSNDFEACKECIKDINEKLKKYFDSNEELNNLYKIYGLINNSKDILIPFDFNPPSENLNQDSINSSFVSTKSNSIEYNPFSMFEEISEERIIPFEYNDNIIQNNDKYFFNEKNITSYEQGTLKENYKKFIENCIEALNLAFLNFSKIYGSKDYEKFPFPGYFMTKLQYLEWILNLDSNLEKVNNNNYGDNLGTIDEGLNNWKNINNNIQDTNEGFVEEGYEIGKEEQSIQNKLLFFINIISKENIKLKKEELQEISTNISFILE